MHICMFMYEKNKLCINLIKIMLWFNFILTQENRFTKCTDCTKYKEQKEKTMDKKVRDEVDALLNKHLELVW